MAPSIVKNKLIWVIALIAILSISGISYVLLNDQPEPPEDDDNDINDQIFIDVQANFSITTTYFYKGENIDFSLELTSNGTTTIKGVTVDIVDIDLGRTASQYVNLNQTINSGTTTINNFLMPGFDRNGFIALTNHTYEITGYNVTWGNDIVTESQVNDASIELTGKKYASHDLMDTMQWNNNSTENVIFSNENGVLNITNTASIELVELNTQINFTGRPRLYYNVSSTNIANANITIENQIHNLNASKDYIPTGNIFGVQNVSIILELIEDETVILETALPTKKIVINTVVASNNWKTPPNADLPFYDPSYYLEQVSLRFEKVFNVTFVPVTILNFAYNQGSNLQNLLQSAINATGEQLHLENEIWELETGTQRSNAGADILLILSNQTMDHLGIVYGSSGSAFNSVIAAQGSLNTGNYRLLSSMADNLIQHELSHVFGAPDRFTDTSNPSIMTKSKPNDAYLDILFQEFWLTLTNWLEEDIQTMTDRIVLYD